MQDARLFELRDSYLDQLIIYLKVQNGDCSLFRTLIDSWHAYHRGGVFVKSTGSPRTLNNPKAKCDLAAMRELPYISQGAAAVLFRGEPGRLVREHTIPVAYLWKMMMRVRERLTTREAIQSYFEQFYHVAALTKAEHDSLKQFSEAMPYGWDEIDCYVRYATLQRYEPEQF